MYAIRSYYDQIHDLDRELRVEVARRLVGEQDLGLVDERRRNRDALLLAARKRERSYNFV